MNGGGEGVSELVRIHMADAGRLGGPIEFETQSLLGEPSAMVGEKELRGAARARVRKRLDPPTGSRRSGRSR